MSHSRMAISSLLSASPTSSLSSAMSTPPATGVALGHTHHHARVRSPGLQPLHLSLPPTLVRRTPSPPLADYEGPRPTKRARSEAEPRGGRAVRPRLEHSSGTSSGTSSAGSSSSRTSYNNPGFYSISSSRPETRPETPPPKLPDALEPMPLATFSATTNAELRWAESRPGSRASSPAPNEHGASTDSTLAVGVKSLVDARASLIGSKAKKAPEDSKPISSSRLAYPSSSERDQPLSPTQRRRSGSGTASTNSDPRSPTSISSFDKDAHDWLIDHYSRPKLRPTSPAAAHKMSSVDDELLDLVDGPRDTATAVAAVLRVKPEVRAGTPDTDRLVPAIRVRA